MLKRVWLSACIALLVSACTGAGMGAGQMAVYPPNAYAHQVGVREVAIYWNCSPRPDGVRVEGVAQNTRGGEIKFLELELVGVDKRDHAVSSAKTALKDIILHTNQISPFALQLEPAGPEARYDLYYQYQLGAPHGTDPLQRWNARDVCSPTQHVVPKIRH